MQQSDSFYEELPYTLQEEHLKSQVLIFGTGLKESLIAAYLSKIQGKKVLILDQEKTYGSCIKSITLKELYLLSQKMQNQRLCSFYVPEKYKKSNEIFYNEKKEKNTLRGYNIDIEPSFFMGNSLACECLKQADMDKYMEFRLINNLLNYEKGKLEEVPLSKGKIFQSKSLSLFEKKNLLASLHVLMRLYQQQMGVEEDMNSTKQFDKGFGVISEATLNEYKTHRENHFFQFLSKITKKNKKIMDLIAYVICNYQYDYSSKTLPEHRRDQYKLRSMIEKFGKFISSCGIYGETPYLYVDNGIGDIPQAYSRIASIFGSTFILHPKIVVSTVEQKQIKCQTSQKVAQQSQSKHQQFQPKQGGSSIVVTSNIAPGKQLHLKKVYYGETFYQLYAKSNPSVSFNTERILRLLVLAKKIGNEPQCPSIAYFIGLQKFSNPVSLFIFDDSTHSCPSGHVVYQFSTILNEEQMIDSNESDLLDKEQQAQGQKISLSERKKTDFIEQRVQILMQKLCQVRGQQFEGSIEFVTSYIRKNFISSKSNENNKDEMQILFRGYEGIDLQGHFNQLAEFVGKKDNYFRKKNPYQEEYQQEDEQGQDYILQQLESIQISHPANSHVDQQNESVQQQITQNSPSNENINTQAQPPGQPQKGE